jgi:RNA polymerase sigma factor (TIGR02999 family)
LDALVPLAYDELLRVARRALRRELPGTTLETAGLVHEAFLRLAARRRGQWANRGEFYAVAAQVMRRVLVDHARSRHAAKRGGRGAGLATGDAEGLGRPDGAGLAVTSFQERPLDVLALHEAVARLAELDPVQGRLVELRYFGGLTIEETAEALGVSPATVKREWSVARAWLRRELGGRDGRPADPSP